MRRASSPVICRKSSAIRAEFGNSSPSASPGGGASATRGRSNDTCLPSLERSTKRPPNCYSCSHRRCKPCGPVTDLIPISRRCGALSNGQAESATQSEPLKMKSCCLLTVCQLAQPPPLHLRHHLQMQQQPWLARIRWFLAQQAQRIKTARAGAKAILGRVVHPRGRRSAGLCLVNRP